MELIQQIEGYFLAIETFQKTNPTKYNEFIEESQDYESNYNYDLITKLSKLRWDFNIYKNTLPKDDKNRYKTLLSLSKLINNCFYDVFLHENKHAILSQNEQLLVSLIDVLKDLESNNKQRLNWVKVEILFDPSPFEREFLDILFNSNYNIKAILEYFETRFTNTNSYDLAIDSLNEFLKLHLGIATRKAEYDQYDKDRQDSAQYNSWAKECRNIPPPQNRL
jgi:hypothetical protein